MAIDEYARWLGRLIVVVAVIMIVWGVSVILSQPVTGWFTASVTVSMISLLLAVLWQLRGSFTSIAASALATAVVSRLFGILNLHPPSNLAGLKPEDLDLLVATGPGVPGLIFVEFILRAASAAARAELPEASLNASSLTFIRAYVGLMFTPHFASHILGGPYQFKIYTLYFASLGLHLPALQVLLAGSIELVSAIGLVLGLFTRPVALLASVYLLMSMLWGGHFHIGYVWALPGGGYEFGLFWAAIIAVFVVSGGGQNSIDSKLWQSEPARRFLPGIIRKILAS